VSRRIRIGLALAAVAAAAYVALLFRSPLKAVGLWAVRRSNACSLGACLEAPSQVRAHLRARDRIFKALRPLRAESSIELWETPLGPLWSPQRRQSAYWLADMLAEAESDVYTYGGIGVRPGDTVLDCGANVGVFARQALRMGAALVVAIEPGPDSLECLRRNFAAEIAARRLIVYPKGVWHREETLRLLVDDNSSIGDSFVLRRGSTEIAVPFVRLDTLVAELGLARVDFVKMDIEGAEQEALAGARQTLARFKPRLAVCAYHKSDDPLRIPALVGAARKDYRMTRGPCLIDKYRIVPKVLFFE